MKLGAASVASLFPDKFQHDAAASGVVRIAEPRPVGDLVKAAINRAAKRVGLSARRVEDLWYAHATMVRSEEMDAIRRADAAREAKEEAAREQAQRLGALFNGVAERLRSQDEDFHSADIAALLDAARALGAVGGAVAEAPALGLTPDLPPGHRGEG